jgi:hypothetical protein
MDHREDQSQNVYQKELEEQLSGKQVVYNDQVLIDGKSYRVPYKMVKEIEFENISKQHMVDMEHAGRLQYRLMLQDSIIRAKVEFVKQKITIVYNPDTAQNNKPKISKEDLISFLAKEGVKIDPSAMKERDFDYFNEMYMYQFNPPSIRERPPYGYTMDEWKKMRDEYNQKAAQGRIDGYRKFQEWQNSYKEQHPDILGETVTNSQEPKKASLKEKIFGKKKNDKEKGFWFHGV